MASPTKGQSSERQSSKPAEIASGKLKRVANLAVDNKARVQPTVEARPVPPSIVPPSDRRAQVALR